MVSAGRQGGGGLHSQGDAIASPSNDVNTQRGWIAQTQACWSL